MESGSKFLERTKQQTKLTLMKPIDFPERTHLIAEHQDEYVTLPALIDDGPRGEVVFCMGLSWKERLKILFTGKLWCSLLCFGKPVTPSFFTVNKHELIVSNAQPHRTETKAASN